METATENRTLEKYQKRSQEVGINLSKINKLLKNKVPS